MQQSLEHASSILHSDHDKKFNTVVIVDDSLIFLRGFNRALSLFRKYRYVENNDVSGRSKVETQ